MPAYALESEREAARLEEMSNLAAYQTSTELENITLTSGQKVLDAGCGSGLVARYIADKFAGVVTEGCDYSEMRIAQAGQIRRAEGGVPIRYFVSPLEKIEAADNTYDLITCRYVFEFLREPVKVLRELKRVLKPGGQLLVIQFDGSLHNFFQRDAELSAMLETLRTHPPVDNFSGRKVYSMMLEAGYADSDWEVKVYGWKADQLLAEQTQMLERLAVALPVLAPLLGGLKNAERFRELFCRQMVAPGSVLFYNKFLVRGFKR